jgi:aryl-alcohol dehydrogenase-like predicted oxidoreductase
VERAHIHAPVPGVALEETLTGINNVHEAGLFERFGLIDFPLAEVERAYGFAKDVAYILPTVYQGCYSHVIRKPESILFPILRRLGISFYAYSPPAGQIYRQVFWKPNHLGALAEWASNTREEGVWTAELVYRWVSWDGILEPQYGDGLPLAARTLE